jgi:hypothetical protein
MRTGTLYAIVVDGNGKMEKVDEQWMEGRDDESMLVGGMTRDEFFKEYLLQPKKSHHHEFYYGDFFFQLLRNEQRNFIFYFVGDEFNNHTTDERRDLLDKIRRHFKFGMPDCPTYISAKNWECSCVECQPVKKD